MEVRSVFRTCFKLSTMFTTHPLVLWTIVVGTLMVVVRASPVEPDLKAEDETELRLLFLMWRHGDRTPLSTYPNDPHKDFQYPPHGLGNLIDIGRLRMQEVGTFLRRRYNTFLGDELTPDLAELWSTSSLRVRQSGQLVVSALFPAADPQTTTFDFSPKGSDSVIGVWDADCPALERIYQTCVLDGKVKDEVLKDPRLYSFLSERTGRAVKTVGEVNVVLDTLTWQDACGLPLPTWTREVYPRLRGKTGIVFNAHVATERGKRLSGGRFLFDMMNSTMAWKKEWLRTGRRPAPRLYAYSAHDFSITGALGVVDMVYPGQPPVGSVVMFELREHKTTGEIGFKILLRNDTRIAPYQLEVPGCGAFCPVDTLQKLYGDRMIPSHEQWQRDCQDREEPEPVVCEAIN